MCGRQTKCAHTLKFNSYLLHGRLRFICMCCSRLEIQIARLTQTVVDCRNYYRTAPCLCVCAHGYNIIYIDLKACNGASRSLFRFHYGRGLSISMSKWYTGRIIIMSSIIVNIAITHQLATKDGPQDDVNVVDVY